GPRFWVSRHLLGRVTHNGAKILAHEGAGKIPGRLRRVNDGGAHGEQILQAPSRIAELSFNVFAFGDVRPRTHHLGRSADLVLDHLERILNPDVVAVAMLEAVFNRAATRLDEGAHFLEHSWCIFGVEVVRPAPLVANHVAWRKAHDHFEILADESTGKIT